MRKQEFLKLLYARLIERGIDEETAKKETSHVLTYLDESGSDDIVVPLDEMVEGVISMIEASDEKKPKPQMTSAPSTPKVKEQKFDNAPATRAASATKQASKPRPEPKASEAKDNQGASRASTKQPPENEEEKRSLLYRMMAKVDKLIKGMQKAKAEKAAKDQNTVETEKAPKKEKKVTENKENVADDSDILLYVPGAKKEKTQYNSNGRMKNEWLYVTILVFAIPIAIALILISVVLYLIFWVALALMMIAFTALLVVFVTVGSFVSIVGIVYGVVELIMSNIPVALFEMGLGIIAGSATMFGGIIVYNIAVRFIPFGMKLLAKLFRLGFRALRSGYNMLKGAVSNL